MVTSALSFISNTENLNVESLKLIAKSRNSTYNTNAFAIYEFAYQEFIQINQPAQTVNAEEIPNEMISENQLFSYLIEGRINMYV